MFIHSNILLVGSPGQIGLIPVHPSSGRAHSYSLTSGNWVHRTILSSSNPRANDNCGGSVVFDKSTDIAAIGCWHDTLNIAMGDNINKANVGSVHVYKFDGSTGFEYFERLSAPDENPYNHFGTPAPCMVLCNIQFLTARQGER